MAVGLSTVNLANAMLTGIKGAGASFTAITTLFLQLHTADPGSAGTTAATADARVSIGFGTPASGSMAVTGTPSFAITVAGPETITHISCFSASSAGTFYWSAALTASKTVSSGDTLNLTTLTFAFTPLAA